MFFPSLPFIYLLLCISMCGFLSFPFFLIVSLIVLLSWFFKYWKKQASDLTCQIHAYHIALPCNHEMCLLCPPCAPFAHLLSHRSDCLYGTHLSWLQIGTSEPASHGSPLQKKEIGAWRHDLFRALSTSGWNYLNLERPSFSPLTRRETQITSSTTESPIGDTYIWPERSLVVLPHVDWWQTMEIWNRKMMKTTIPALNRKNPKNI